MGGGQRLAKTVAAGVLLAGLLAPIGAALVDVSAGTVELGVVVVAGSGGSDGNHVITIEPFKDVLRDGWRVRIAGGQEIRTSDNDCFQFLGDVVCNSPRSAVEVDGGRGLDNVEVITRAPGATCVSGTVASSIISFDVSLGGAADRLSTSTGLGCPAGQSLDLTISPVYEVDGGGGADTLNGAGRGDRLVGGTGADFLNGRDGEDVLVATGDGDALSGGEGIDTVTYAGLATTTSIIATIGSLANDGPQLSTDDIRADVENVIGSNGDDSFRGDADANVLTGGPGRDTLDGAGARDSLVGGQDADTIQARDSLFDDISCGPGTDTAVGDLVDFLTGGPTFFRRNFNGLDCENLDIMAIDDGLPARPLGRVLRRGADRKAAVTIHCPRGARIACRGELTARLGRANGPLLGRTRYGARLRGRTTVRVALGGARRGAKVYLQTLERGVSKKGPRRSIRLYRLVG